VKERGRLRTCMSVEADEWFLQASRAKGTEAHKAAIKFRAYVAKRLEPFGFARAELPYTTFHKIKGVDRLWQLRVDAYRLLMTLAGDDLIIGIVVIAKRTEALPQDVYKRHAARGAELVQMAKDGRLRC
jgi:mRNA-degrading endonuclease RelE of RelBE toxin-antitoxin system